MDEEAILRQAMLLSMQNEQQQQQQQKAQENQFSEILDNDFVGQIVKDLNLDMNDQDISNLLSDVQKKDDEEKKKKEEEDKK